MRPTRGHLVFYERAWGTTPQRHVADRGRPVGASWEPAALGGNRGDSPRCRPWPPRARLVGAHGARWATRGFAALPPAAAPRALGGSREDSPRGRQWPPRHGAGWVTRGFAPRPPRGRVVGASLAPAALGGPRGVAPRGRSWAPCGRLAGVRGAGRATWGFAALPLVAAPWAFSSERPRRWVGHAGLRRVAAARPRRWAGRARFRRAAAVGAP